MYEPALIEPDHSISHPWFKTYTRWIHNLDFGGYSILQRVGISTAAAAVLILAILIFAQVTLILNPYSGLKSSLSRTLRTDPYFMTRIYGYSSQIDQIEDHIDQIMIVTEIYDRGKVILAPLIVAQPKLLAVKLLFDDVSKEVQMLSATFHKASQISQVIPYFESINSPGQELSPKEIMDLFQRSTISMEGLEEISRGLEKLSDGIRMITGSEQFVFIRDHIFYNTEAYTLLYSWSTLPDRLDEYNGVLQQDIFHLSKIRSLCDSAIQKDKQLHYAAIYPIAYKIHEFRWSLLLFVFVFFGITIFGFFFKNVPLQIKYWTEQDRDQERQKQQYPVTREYGMTIDHGTPIANLALSRPKFTFILNGKDGSRKIYVLSINDHLLIGSDPSNDMHINYRNKRTIAKIRTARTFSFIDVFDHSLPILRNCKLVSNNVTLQHGDILQIGDQLIVVLVE